MDDLQKIGTLILQYLTITNSDTFQIKQFLTLSNLSNFYFLHFPIRAVCPISAVADTLQSKQFLTFSNSVTFQTWWILTISNFGQFWHFPVLVISKTTHLNLVFFHGVGGLTVRVIPTYRDPSKVASAGSQTHIQDQPILSQWGLFIQVSNGWSINIFLHKTSCHF